LAEGVLRTMLLSKLWTVAAILAVLCVLGAATVALTQPLPAVTPLDQQPPAADKPARQPLAQQKDPIPQPVVDAKKPAAPPAQEEETDEPLPTSVSGVVKAVDATNNTLTVAHAQGETTFSVAKGAKVSIDGRPGNLTALPPGANVHLSQFVDAKSVRSVDAGGRSLGGTVKAVDAAQGTITVGDKTYAVAPNVHVAIDDKTAKMAGIPLGSSVWMTMRADQTTVHNISAYGANVFGTVKAVDTVRNIITVAGPPEDRTISVPSDTIIVIDGKTATLAAIPKGSILHALTLRVDQKTAHRIHVEGPGYHHVLIKSVDAANNTITLDDKEPPQVAGKTLPVAADAHILIDGQSG